MVNVKLIRGAHTKYMSMTMIVKASFFRVGIIVFGVLSKGGYENDELRGAIC